MKALVIGAHPDDAEYLSGGTVKKFTNEGHIVKFISMTNGDAGHHLIFGQELASQRLHEAQTAAIIAGVDYEVLNNHDCSIFPSQQNRDEIIRLIRKFDPELILTHRPYDYHPDHRYSSLMVQDASYLLTVPSICPDVPHLRKKPIILYLEDSFKKPIEFQADIIVSIDNTIDDKIAMLNCHVSQFYEWLPYNDPMDSLVPTGQAEKIRWLGEQIKTIAAKTADRFRSVLIDLYGKKLGNSIHYAEAFEFCEYGQKVSYEDLICLFPFKTVL